VNLLIPGAIVMACLVAGLFFLRFWRTTGDRIFACFALAFWLMASQWTAGAVLDVPSETRHYLYLLRLLAFVIIVVGIVDKNRKR